MDDIGLVVGLVLRDFGLVRMSIRSTSLHIQLHSDHFNATRSHTPVNHLYPAAWILDNVYHPKLRENSVIVGMEIDLLSTLTNTLKG
jgi:hypothetical protein